MKKLDKKGFTLIELLAVIAILAILVVIAVPGVLTMYQSGKKNAFESQAKAIWKSLETQVISDAITEDIAPVYCFDGSEDELPEGKESLSNKNILYYAEVNTTTGKITNLQVQQVTLSGNTVQKIIFTTAPATTQAGLTANTAEGSTDLDNVIKCS